VREETHAVVAALSDDLLVGSTRALLRLAARLPASGQFDDDLRTVLAAQSAQSHSGWGYVGRGSFSSPVWFVATELSRALGIPKFEALAILLPTWEAAVVEGPTGWGSPARLDALGASVGAVHEAEPPERGWVGRFVRSLDSHGTSNGCADAPRDAARAREVADACMRRWGGGLPILSGLTANDVELLVSSALADY